jgi:hypothetical protein
MCVLATVGAMMWSFDTISRAAPPITPADLSSKIKSSLLFGVPAVPLGIVGVSLIIYGLVFRKHHRQNVEK